jgi:hypothetical protein
MSASDVSYFAHTNSRSDNRLFGIKQADRLSHLYVIGKMATGNPYFSKQLYVRVSMLIAILSRSMRTGDLVSIDRNSLRGTMVSTQRL